MSGLRTTIFVTIMLALSGGLFGCVNSKQCETICERYQDCFDSEYDVSECVDTCIENSKDEAQYEEQVDVCEVCVEDRSCSESFACAGECAGIVP